jgi:hypothetical protein
VRLTTSLPLRAECHEIWEPKTPGTPWAPPGFLQDSFAFLYIPPIMIINRMYENQNLLSFKLFSFLVGLRTYQHPCKELFDTDDKFKQAIMMPQINLLSIPPPNINFVTVKKPRCSPQSSPNNTLQNF